MILITGSTGLVGRHLMLALIEKGNDVRALYRSEDKRAEVMDFYAFAKAESHTHHIDWQQGDITDIPRLSNIFKDIAYVYHCAAMISFDPYQFKQLTNINIEGTTNVINLSLSNSITKLVHLSSIATLAHTPHDPITEQNYWDPDAQNSVYALTKYGAEMEVWRGTQEGLNAVILNPGLILGEGDIHSGSGALFKRALKEKKYYPNGGSAVIDVKDLVQLMIQAMSSTITQKRYIAISQNIHYKELMTAISQALGKKPPSYPVNTYLLSLLVFADWMRGIFTRKRTLTKATKKSLTSISTYTNEQIVTDFNYTFTPLQQTLDRISSYIKASRSIPD